MSVMNTSELGEFVKKWVHYDQLAGNLSRQASNARRARDTIENSILQWLRSNSMMNSIIQIGGGRLTVHEEKHTAPLTFQRLEGHLREYYRQKRNGSPDETDDILKFIRDHRHITTETRLKKS